MLQHDKLMTRRTGKDKDEAQEQEPKGYKLVTISKGNKMNYPKKGDKVKVKASHVHS